ncbi:hypothetical protein [Erythrobacter sp.]|uniref:hypothetical protein n=1 Tax=Erythrobacter sp. TaxID=1042 RepID=UPI003C76849B
MNSGPSLLSLLAACLYAGIVATCLLAWRAARPANVPPWHRRAWIALALLFVALALLRFFALEEGFRDLIREAMRQDGSYSNRRRMQEIAAAIAISAIAIAAGIFAFRQRRGPWLRGRRNRAVSAASVAGAALMALLGLRLISLHAIDALLYGPLKLNWFADIGASLLVAGAALYYTWRVRSAR